MLVSDESSHSSETQPSNMSQQVKLCDFQLEQPTIEMPHESMLRHWSMPVRIQVSQIKLYVD